jgi:DNA-binding MarR family transcriptional regulator
MPSKKVSQLGDHTGYLMRQISNNISGDFALKMQNMGITIAEWVVMRIMFDHSATTHTHIVEVSGLTKGAISKTLTKLIMKKLIEKKESVSDGRSQILELSKQAKKLVPILAEIADQNEAGYFSVLTHKEQIILRKLLDKMIKAKEIKGAPID